MSLWECAAHPGSISSEKGGPSIGRVAVLPRRSPGYLPSCAASSGVMWPAKATNTELTRLRRRGQSMRHTSPDPAARQHVGLILASLQNKCVQNAVWPKFRRGASIGSTGDQHGGDVWLSHILHPWPNTDQGLQRDRSGADLGPTCDRSAARGQLRADLWSMSGGAAHEGDAAPGLRAGGRPAGGLRAVGPSASRGAHGSVGATERGSGKWAWRRISVGASGGVSSSISRG